MLHPGKEFLNAVVFEDSAIARDAHSIAREEAHRRLITHQHTWDSREHPHRSIR
eukprot:CAMPEP_0206134358 /NCGR_PEP_ID=MMETSP1472-20131121/54843_1 /ASSEMBLY_ACC=CAM_ASM_001108 /TAXON_ID=41880 /ORGANISM="Pycnococcus provasolii, Strain RCC251" /LENGTH=53 /DNA_ID=CAMNT_0053525961 /DNA_START=1 /DNA_END=162 /DNA_ORIENTATION=+